ncbi:MAG: 1-(5-phosphoribosyl)-5-[Clostridium sp.]|nr:1-(5-phosphoribosyl)-5-[(5-phosphoribosylamino)methylideneamino]imidazole-4-carboxamide isomerase [Clostridium sp.]
MKVIPAIDIINGKAVRLLQGDYNKTNYIGEDILDIAKSFKESGADLIHLIDLDGAKLGHLVNKDIILNVVKTLKIDVEVGGGIRNYDDIEALIEGGVSRVILGTIAIEDKDLLKKAVNNFGDKIAVAVDFKDGYIRTKGWITKSDVHYIDLIKDLEEIGVKNIIVTDISKDGTLEGSNVSVIESIKNITNMDITASGGVKDINDVIALNNLDIYGCITGKAIYSKTIDLKEAINLCKK